MRETNAVATAVASEPADEPTNPLVAAIKNLTQGTQNLLKHHIDLARYELTADMRELSKDALGLAAALGLGLIGYLLLNVAGVLFAAWFAGIKGMAIAALVLALLHVGGAAWAASSILAGIKKRRYGMTYTSNEIERSKEWAVETTQQITQEP